MTKGANDRHSFILRIWREGNESEWRGWVQHASSGEFTIFHDIGDLMVFVEHFMNETHSHTLRNNIRTGGKSKPGLK